MVIGAVVALLVVGVLAYFFGRSADESKVSTETSTVIRTVTTATATVATQPSTTSGNSGNSTDAAATEDGGASAGTSNAQSGTAEISHHSVMPSSTHSGDPITFSVVTYGDITGVQVKYGPAGGDVGSGTVIDLNFVSGSQGMKNWEITAAAPHGSTIPEIQGQCSYVVWATESNGTVIRTPSTTFTST